MSIKNDDNNNKIISYDIKNATYNNVKDNEDTNEINDKINISNSINHIKNIQSKYIINTHNNNNSNKRIIT